MPIWNTKCQCCGATFDTTPIDYCTQSGCGWPLAAVREACDYVPGDLWQPADDELAVRLPLGNPAPRAPSAGSGLCLIPRYANGYGGEVLPGRQWGDPAGRPLDLLWVRKGGIEVRMRFERIDSVNGPALCTLSLHLQPRHDRIETLADALLPRLGEVVTVAGLRQLFHPPVVVCLPDVLACQKRREAERVLAEELDGVCVQLGLSLTAVKLMDVSAGTSYADRRANTAMQDEMAARKRAAEFTDEREMLDLQIAIGRLDRADTLDAERIGTLERALRRRARLLPLWREFDRHAQEVQAARDAHNEVLRADALDALARLRALRRNPPDGA